MRPLLAIAVVFLATNNVVQAAVDCSAPHSSPCKLAQEEADVLGACGLPPLATDTNTTYVVTTPENDTKLLRRLIILFLLPESGTSMGRVCRTTQASPPWTGSMTGQHR